jgi:hypothetical protein
VNAEMELKLILIHDNVTVSLERVTLKKLIYIYIYIYLYIYIYIYIQSLVTNDGVSWQAHSLSFIPCPPSIGRCQ